MVDGVVVPALTSVALAKEIVMTILSAPGIWYVVLTIVVQTFQLDGMERNCINRIVAPKTPKVTKTIIPPKTCLANYNTVHHGRRPWEKMQNDIVAKKYAY